MITLCSTKPTDDSHNKGYYGNDDLWRWYKDREKYIQPKEQPKQPCRHENCPECHGTGRKKNGHECIHMISCQCPKCMGGML